MEDIAFGERVSQYVLEAFVDGEWLELTRGLIGHKKIDAFSQVTADKVRMRVLESASPKIKVWRLTAGNKRWILYRCGGICNGSAHLEERAILAERATTGSYRERFTISVSFLNIGRTGY